MDKITRERIGKITLGVTLAFVLAALHTSALQAYPKQTAEIAEPAPTRQLVSLEDAKYIGNANSLSFHKIDCSSVSKMKEANKVPFATREEAIQWGFKPCGQCSP